MTEEIPGKKYINNKMFAFNIPYGFCTTLKGKSRLCIPFLGIARPQTQFPHSCGCERFIYYQDRSTYFLAAE
jgi:hypothetical protein